MKELLNKPAQNIIMLGYTTETIDAELRSLTRQMDELREKIAATMYVGHVIRKGFGVGDMINKDGIRLKVTSYDRGFWAIDPKEKKSKERMVYEGWQRI
jgi:hypothetical protein